MPEKRSVLFENCAWNVKYTNVNDWVSYAFVEENETLYIYFQGSCETRDWIANFLFPAKPYKDMGIPYRVHRGFLAAWKEVEDIIIEKITERKPYGAWDYKYRKIVVIGYSHGGALAGFCHECVWFHRPDLRDGGLSGYGFEAPRFYAGLWVKPKLQERWKTFEVIRTNNDIVTHAPPAIFGYCHVGTIHKVSGDVKLVDNKLPKCVKSHYPQVVLDALLREENQGGETK